MSSQHVVCLKLLVDIIQVSMHALIGAFEHAESISGSSIALPHSPGGKTAAAVSGS